MGFMENPRIVKRVLLNAVLVVLCCGIHGVRGDNGPAFACDNRIPNAATYPFCRTSLSLKERVNDLIGRLTLQEKVGQLVDKAAAIPRLGIPSYEWWSEALHGVSNVGPGTRFGGSVPAATSFPQVILTASSFNASLWKAIGQVVSTEARAMYNAGLAGLTYWSPNVNIFRDPRWGRGQETPGEDPLLASKYAASYVRGLQGTNSADPNRLKVAACCKHYTAYDLDKWGSVDRFHFDARVSQQDLDDTYQPPFRSCVIDGQVASVMCSYNKVNGVPTCADANLLNGVVRGKWGLNGYIASDCDSVEVLFSSQHYAATPEDAAADVIRAGLDLNCGSFLGRHTEAAVRGGKVQEALVDKALFNTFTVQMRLGLFDGNPARQPYGNLGPRDVCTQEHQELALEAARQGIVLLKNKNDALPFSPSRIKSLAVIGPNADVTNVMIGNYAGIPCRYTSPLQGLRKYIGGTVYQRGCTSVACNDLSLGGASQAASQADATVIIVGADQSIEAEGFDRPNLLLPGQQQQLVLKTSEASKGPVVLVIMSGGPMDISFAKYNDKISSILWVGYPGQAGGAALADVIFGRYNPGGRLPVTWYPQEFAAKVPMTDMNMRPDPATGYPGRTYRFYTGKTVYKFGDGLSYTTYSHSLVNAPKLVSVPLEAKHKCHATTHSCRAVHVKHTKCEGLIFDLHIDVENRGSRDGQHTVFLFSSPPAIHRAPRKQLLGFEKIHVGARTKQRVHFNVDVCRDLSIVDESGIRKLPLGSHLLHIGDLQHSLNLHILNGHF